MNDIIAPRLRADVLMRPFEAFEGDSRIVVGVDGRHFLVSIAVAVMLDESRQERTLTELATRVSERLGVTVSPQLAGKVLSEQVLAVLFCAPEPRAAQECPIRLRHSFIGGRALRPLLEVLARLFNTPVAIALVATLLLAEVLVATHAATSVSAPLSGSGMLWAVTLTLLGVFVHELGHLAACARFGAPHGGIGVGLYWCFPVLYAEVNGAWMLPRLQRAAVDAGGLYFQGLYVLALEATYLTAPSPVVLSAIVWSHVLMLHTLNPVLKYDGYWLLMDLTGSVNLHARVRDHVLQAWRAWTGVPDAGWPPLPQLAMVCAFVVLTGAYLFYVMAVLGRAIGESLAEAQRVWTTDGGTALGAWRAAGEHSLFFLFVLAGGALALMLAGSLTRIARGVDR